MPGKSEAKKLKRNIRSNKRGRMKKMNKLLAFGAINPNSMQSSVSNRNDLGRVYSNAPPPGHDGAFSGMQSGRMNFDNGFNITGRGFGMNAFSDHSQSRAIPSLLDYNVNLRDGSSSIFGGRNDELPPVSVPYHCVLDRNSGPISLNSRGDFESVFSAPVDFAYQQQRPEPVPPPKANLGKMVMPEDRILRGDDFGQCDAYGNYEISNSVRTYCETIAGRLERMNEQQRAFARMKIEEALYLAQFEFSEEIRGREKVAQHPMGPDTMDFANFSSSSSRGVPNFVRFDRLNTRSGR